MPLQTSKLPKSYWKSIENRKNFLDEITKKLNLKTPSDWGKITQQQFCEAGGSGIIKYYNNSLFACLQSVYKDINWKREWFYKLSKSYWKSMENRKIFLDEIAKKLNIEAPSDWKNITWQRFCELGGSSILKYYNGSLFACLQSVYKDINWKREWFDKLPKSHWNSMENRRNFLDEIAKKLNIQIPSDWGNVTVQQFHELGGSSLLSYHYKNSLFTCLQSVYKDINWKREWFINLSRFPKTHWNSIENCRSFMNGIAMNSNVISPNDWRKVSLSLIRNNGGQGLLHKYQGNMQSILKSIYSIQNSNDLISFLSSEKILEESIKGIVSNCRNVNKFN